jgi:hypothetical protein
MEQPALPGPAGFRAAFVLMALPIGIGIIALLTTMFLVSMTALQRNNAGPIARTKL